MTGKAIIDYIILGINLLVGLGCIGIYFLGPKFILPQPLNAELELQSLQQSAYQESQIKAISIPNKVINIYSPKTRLRFVDLEIGIIPIDNSLDQLVKNNESMILDEVIAITSEMSPEELESLSGKVLLGEKIKNRINQNLNKKVVRKILFTKFIVQ